ncbi:hydantoinase B/oxoprolinase family protein [Amycolatopsis sp. NPDC051061]|uniref:hydantoinase B/oxoprolinase family protein n=1 Tax=Amycolatopsis sp. NPDC051061 TaxID=3155042 RepID=UPI003433E543
MTETKPGVPGAAPATVDPFTLEIIKSKLDRAADEGCVALELTAGSIPISEAHDRVVGLYTDDGDLLAGGAGFMSVLPGAGLAIRHVLRTYAEDPGIGEGDVFLVNDPYVGAAHAPDAMLIAPIFVGERRVGFACAYVHVTDIGGIQPGGWHTEATESYQEGFQTGGLKIIEAGRLRRDIWDTVLRQVRFPERVTLDLRSIVAACNVAQDRFMQIFATYGEEVTLAACRQLVSRSEETLRQRLRELPDGEWTARLYFDYHGARGEAVYPVVLTLRKEADLLKFDFAGTHDQVDVPINCPFGLTYGCVIGPLYSLLSWDIPINEGIHRCIEVVAEEGTIANPRRPGPVSCATEAMAHIIQNLSAMVLSKMMGTSQRYSRRATAQWGAHAAAQMFGLDASHHFVTEATSDLFASSAGAQSFQDGADVGGEMAAPTTRIPNTETSELYFPARFLYKRIVPDSGGPGKFRGGTIIEWAVVPHNTPAQSFSANMFSGRGVTFPQAQGIFGGLPGCTTDYVQYRGGNAAEFPSNRRETTGREENVRFGVTHIGPDDVMYLRTGGGGGFGDPLERDPERVAQDVASGFVSVPAAHAVYGVVLDADRHDVDAAATAELRTDVRRRRLGGTEPAAVDDHAELALGDRPLGGYLHVVDEPGTGPVIRCARCSHEICAADADWKDHVPHREAPLAEAGPVHRDTGECVLREFYCPGCAAMLEVEMARPGDPPLHDRVTGWPA